MKKLTARITGHGEAITVALLILLAFSLRYWFFWNHPYPLMLHEQDGIAYMLNARDILSFKAPGNLFMPPFYSLLIALFSILPVKFEIAARLASITMDSLLVLPIYGLARIILPWGGAVAVGVLWSTFAFSLFFSPSPLSQSSYLCMLLAGVYLLYRALAELRPLFFALSGVCLACAYLSRPEGIVAILIALTLTGISALRPGANRPGHLKGGVILLAAFLLTASPYLLMLRNHFGFWTFTAKTVVAIKGIDGSQTLGQNNDAALGGVDLWLKQFGGVSGGIKFISANMAGFFNTLARSFSTKVHVFAIIGIPFAFIGKNFFSRLFLLFPFFMTIPVYVANLPKTHSYIYPLFPLHMILFVAGTWGIISLLNTAICRLWGGQQSKLLAIVSLLLLFIPVTVIGLNGVREAAANYMHPDYLYQVDQTNHLFKAAGEDIKAASAPKDLLMTRWGLVSYFAERPLMNMPKGEIAEVLAEGRKAGARLLLIDTESVGTRRQELKELLGPLGGIPVNPAYGIEVVTYRMTDYGGYVIYRYR